MISVLKMWKRTFDFKGKSGRKEFVIPLIFHILIAAAMIALFILDYEMIFDSDAPQYIAEAMAVYLVISCLPFASLTVRRLHDAGKSGWWYFIIMFFGIGAFILIILCILAAATYDPADNIPSAVYGPPPSEDVSETETYADRNDIPDMPEEIFKPENNFDAPVYGPPPREDREETTTAMEFPEAPADDEDGEGAAALTAVTAMISAADTETREDGELDPFYGLDSADDFDPPANTAVEVYGPPEWFE